jgi:SSS family solute:Na+ symporter
MAITFLAVASFMAVVTLVRPLSEPVVLPVRDSIPLEPAPGARWWGLGVVLGAALLYWYFW